MIYILFVEEALHGRQRESGTNNLCPERPCIEAHSGVTKDADTKPDNGSLNMTTTYGPPCEFIAKRRHASVGSTTYHNRYLERVLGTH